MKKEVWLRIRAKCSYCSHRFHLGDECVWRKGAPPLREACARGFAEDRPARAITLADEEAV